MLGQSMLIRAKKGIFFTDHGILAGIRHRIAPKLSQMEAPCLIYPGSFYLFRIFRCAAISDFFKMVTTFFKPPWRGIRQISANIEPIGFVGGSNCVVRRAQLICIIGSMLPDPCPRPNLNFSAKIGQFLG